MAHSKHAIGAAFQINLLKLVATTAADPRFRNAASKAASQDDWENQVQEIVFDLFRYNPPGESQRGGSVSFAGLDAKTSKAIRDRSRKTKTPAAAKKATIASLKKAVGPKPKGRGSKKIDSVIPGVQIYQLDKSPHAIFAFPINWDKVAELHKSGQPITIEHIKGVPEGWPTWKTVLDANGKPYKQPIGHWVTLGDLQDDISDDPDILVAMTEKRTPIRRPTKEELYCWNIKDKVESDVLSKLLEEPTKSQEVVESKAEPSPPAPAQEAFDGNKHRDAVLCSLKNVFADFDDDKLLAIVDAAVKDHILQKGGNLEKSSRKIRRNLDKLTKKRKMSMIDAIFYEREANGDDKLGIPRKYIALYKVPKSDDESSDSEDEDEDEAEV